MTDNPIHEAEREEARDARHALTEVDRAVGCGHTNRRRGVCPDCGDDIRGDV